MATCAHITEFHLEHIERDGVQILCLTGYLGNAEFAQVDALLSPLLAQRHGRVIIDLTTLTFTTTVSLARFLVCGRTFRRRGGALKFVGLSPHLSQIATMAGFDAERDFEPDVPAALQSMSRTREVNHALDNRQVHRTRPGRSNACP